MKATRTEHLLALLVVAGLSGCGGPVSGSKPSSDPAELTQAEAVSDSQSEPVTNSDAAPETTTDIMSADAAEKPAEPASDVKLYEPVESDFHSAYHADSRNREKQTLSEYFRWVKAFYHGEFLVTGWMRQSESIVKMCQQPEGRPTVITMLNDAGRKIASEWSKDGKVRRINNTDLQNWGAKLTKCAKDPQGSTESIKSALKDIITEIDQKLASIE